MENKMLTSEEFFNEADEADRERRRLSLDFFIKKSHIVHGNKYDYSKVEYVNNGDKVCIICPEHGEFWQTKFDHTHGLGCPKCVNSYIPIEGMLINIRRDDE